MDVIDLNNINYINGLGLQLFWIVCKRQVSALEICDQRRRSWRREGGTKGHNAPYIEKFPQNY